MNNLKKIGLTALAGSMVAFSAQALEMSVSGTAKMTYVTEGGSTNNEDVTGNPYGFDQTVAFNGSGDSPLGTISLMHVHNGSATSSSLLTIDMGDSGKLTLDNGVGAEGAGTIKDMLPRASGAEQAWDDTDGDAYYLDTASAGAWGYSNTFGGISLSVGYAKNGGGFTGDDANTDAGDDSDKSFGVKDINLIGASGTPEIESPNNLNIKATNVAISTDMSIGGELTVTDKKICVGKNTVVMSGFRDYMLDKYIRKLQNVDYTAVVFSQDEKAAGTTRSLTGIFSPGTFFNEDTTTITNTIVCIWIQKYKDQMIVGLSGIDIFTGKSSIFEYQEQFSKYCTSYDELERYISIHNPSEVVLIHNLDDSLINNIINYKKNPFFLFKNKYDNSKMLSHKNILRDIFIRKHSII